MDPSSSLLLDVAQVLWIPGDTRASETPHGSSWVQGQRAGLFSEGRAGLSRVMGQRGKENRSKGKAVARQDEGMWKEGSFGRYRVSARK